MPLGLRTVSAVEAKCH